MTFNFKEIVNKTKNTDKKTIKKIKKLLKGIDFKIYINKEF